MNLLEVQHLSKSFTKNKKVLDTVSFSLEKGKVLAIVGESGSGKTTLMRTICGLERLNQGTISLSGKSISSEKVMVQPEKRNIGLVFQDYALFPHLTVFGNVIYGINKDPDKNQKVAQMLKMVGLTGFEKRYPHQLSGGQQQRVALARALAPNPQLLILDEPFSNLDVILKDQLRNEVFEIIRSTGVTAIFVTHDTEDALSVSDQILVLKDGVVQQTGTAESIFQTPNSLYIASLFGEMITFSHQLLGKFGFELENNKEYGIRINKVTLDSKSDFSLEATVIQAIFLGEKYVLKIGFENGEIIRVYGDKKMEGTTVQIGFDKEDVLSFDN